MNLYGLFILDVNIKYIVFSILYVIDIAWQSVLYGLYSPEGEGCIIHTARDCHAIMYYKS